ncbi:uncharacterized protein LOC134813243 [Bolinopsis microptera]|uniref:uncharacterized protein LOC134813243 n=1 Tax=Bolinopsis microptera TaxID=2820187 RepID=UPI00307986ED
MCQLFKKLNNKQCAGTLPAYATLVVGTSQLFKKLNNKQCAGTLPASATLVVGTSQLFKKLNNKQCAGTLPAPATLVVEFRCPEGSSKCLKGRECVRDDHVCDGNMGPEYDCTDGSDELDCDYDYERFSWSDFGSWSSCSAICGGGTRFRERRCLDTISYRSVTSRFCEGNITHEHENCSTHNCPNEVQFALYGSDGKPSNGSAGIVLAKVLNWTVTVSLADFLDHKADVICRELGYDHSEDWFGAEVSFFTEAWYDKSVDEQEKVNLEHDDKRAMRYKQGYDKAMSILNCDEAKSYLGFENCSYSLEILEKNDNKYNRNKYYSLGLLCNIQPESCTITEHRGFLKNVCQIDAYFEVFECLDSSAYYVYLPIRKPDGMLDDVSYLSHTSVSKICSDDPHVYQGCIAMDLIPPTRHISGPFCETNFSKDIKGRVPNMFDLYVDAIPPQDNIITKCDGLCDDSLCRDEALCNGYRYDWFCDGKLSIVMKQNFLYLSRG